MGELKGAPAKKDSLAQRRWKGPTNDQHLRAAAVACSNLQRARPAAPVHAMLDFTHLLFKVVNYYSRYDNCPSADMEAQNLVKRSLAQALVNALFLVVGYEVPVQFERGSAELKLALGDDHDTVNAGAELLGQCEKIASGVGFASVDSAQRRDRHLGGLQVH